MSLAEVTEAKQMFYECYKIIDNILSKGFWYCHCHEYSGCPTILNFLKNDKRYCYVSQFQGEFSFFGLHKIKRFLFIHSTVTNNYLNELIGYLFNLDV